ncbi:MAG TPA: AraD1 family protein [Bryobacteraceae bacterium]|jgi:hypothetical protein
MRLVQLEHRSGQKRAALVDESFLKPLARFSSVYELVWTSLAERQPLRRFVLTESCDEPVRYDDVYSGNSDWRLLPPIDHISDPAHCLISGTGLTHTASAEKRRAMHQGVSEENDSSRMYRWGLEQGRPGYEEIGVSPEWFYKGNGGILRAHGESLAVPNFAEDAGEEPEIAGVYLIDMEGRPRRIGMAIGNEFADHQFERRNYLYLAASKLRQCALGPELVVDPIFDDVRGRVKIEREGSVLWSAELATGEKQMCHSLANIEHHHFKFDEHRRPGDVHIHFYGADAFSFGEGIALEDGDIVEIAFEGFGRPLRNSIRFQPGEPARIQMLPV